MPISHDSPSLRAIRFWGRAACLSALLVGLLAGRPVSAVAAPAASPVVQGVRVVDRNQVQLLDASDAVLGTLTVPCSQGIADVLRLGSMLYVACGPDGVLAFDLAATSDGNGPRLVSRFGAGRSAVRLAQSGSQLLVIVAEYGVLAYALHDPQHPQLSTLGLPTATGTSLASPQPLPPSSSPPPTSSALQGQAQGPASVANPSPAVGPSPAVQGSAIASPLAPKIERAASSAAVVSKVSSGWVAITSPQPFSMGDRFVLRSQRRVRTTDPTTGRSEQQPSNEALGMFAVERLYPPSSTSGQPTFTASGRLLRGTVPRVGDLAQPTDDPLREPLYVPRLWYGMFRFYGHLRPMVGVSPLAYAMVNDFRFDYYLPVPIKIGVSLAPLSFLSSSPVAVVSEARGHVGFSSSYFEVSLDPGIILNRLGGRAFSFGFSVRLGSLDGLNLIFHSSYRLRQGFGQPSDLAFYGAGGEINIPLSKRFTLHLLADGSQANIWGTLGLKYWLRGNGGPGTLILDSGVGGAYIDDTCAAIDSASSACFPLGPLFGSSQARNGGPIASLGLDARF